MLRFADSFFAILRKRSVALATVLVLASSTALALVLVLVVAPLLSAFVDLPIHTGAMLLATALITPVVTLPFSLIFTQIIRQLALARRHLRTEVELHREAREALLEAKIQAEGANEAKSKFMASMSHELRTPLTAIIGFSEILSHDVIAGLDREKAREYGSDIARSAHHLLSLIDDLLDLSRIEAAAFELQEEEVGLGELMTDAVRMSGAVFERQGASLRRIPGAEGVRMHVDRRRLCQVLINVLTNAAKYGGASPVRLEAIRENDGAVRFTIADDGPGMTAKDIVEALRPFGRTDEALRSPVDGIGLGLPIAEQIMRLHGGSLRIDSLPGRGTRVFLRLPASRVVSADLPAPGTMDQASA